MMFFCRLGDPEGLKTGLGLKQNTVSTQRLHKTKHNRVKAVLRYWGKVKLSWSQISYKMWCRKIQQQKNIVKNEHFLLKIESNKISKILFRFFSIIDSLSMLSFSLFSKEIVYFFIFIWKYDKEERALISPLECSLSGFLMPSMRRISGHNLGKSKCYED
jgi:hypothetical protein